MKRAPRSSCWATRVKHSLVMALAVTAAESALADMDFVQGWQAVVTQSPAYAAAMAQAAAGQAKVDQAKALWRPHVVISTSAGWASQRTSAEGAGFTAPGFGTSEDVAFRTQVDHGLGSAVSLMAQQPLVNGGRQASAQQLEAMARLAGLQGQVERQALVWRLVESHLQVLAAREAVRTADAEEKAADRAADAARERFDSGAAPVTAVHDARARRDQAAARGVQARQALAVAELGYRQLTGQPGASPAELLSQIDGASVDAVEIDDASWLKMARDQGLAGRMAEASVAIAQAELDKQSATANWSLDLVGRLSDERLRGDGPHVSGGQDARATARSQWVGLQLQVPLYTGGMDSARHREASLALQAALARQQEVDELVVRDVRAAWLGVQSAQAQVAASLQAQRSANERLGATRTGHDVGHKTVLELLDAERDALQAQLQAVAARHQWVLAMLRLDFLGGRLDEAALARANAWLQPAPATLANRP